MDCFVCWVPVSPGREVPVSPGRGVPVSPGRGVPVSPGRCLPDRRHAVAMDGGGGGSVPDDAWSCVFTSCSSKNLCKLAQTCKMFHSIVQDAALAKLSPSGFFYPMVCEYLNDFGGKTCNDFHANVLLPGVVVKLHYNALKTMPLLSISIFSSIIKCEVQIQGMRLIANFFQKGILLRSDSQFASNIKKLFYYETTMSTVMDIVMLQGILCNVFQLSVEDVMQFGTNQVLCSPDSSESTLLII